ncbi:MAG: NUDIX hydrolase [Deltaproteobacteria bacterium]|nr:NUDIX hydrolase [Deltaproteobacteria bacterium]
MHRLKAYRFCPKCGGKLECKLLKSGEPKRFVCSQCQYVFYIDPKLAACTISEISGRIVMLRRGIPPCFGLWVIPGGFVDVGETVEEAAKRETLEEVGLNVDIGPLVGVYSYHDSSVAIVVYEATILDGIPEALDESLEVGLFEPENIPWLEIAFRSTEDALRDYLERQGF